MTNDPRLERYLTSLEAALRAFPVSDRAEIITEIKSHVYAALERDPQTRLDTVLTALGEPETVANRYLLERGLTPAKPSISPIVKWLVIGFLCTLAMILIFAGFVLNHFNSLVQVDGNNERVQILGGLIDVDGKRNRISIHGIDDGSAFAGTTPLSTDKSIVVRFNSGKIEVQVADDDQFGWACKGRGETTPEPKMENGVVYFDTTAMRSVKCTFAVPRGASLFELQGENGQVDLQSPAFPTITVLQNGKVNFQPAADVHYKYEVAVEQGRADKFESSQNPAAINTRIQLKRGSVELED